MEDATTIRMVSWNLAGRWAPWGEVIDDAYDVALLQEALIPPDSELQVIPADRSTWSILGVENHSRTCIAAREGIEIREVPMRRLGDELPGEIGVSRCGTLTVAELGLPSFGAIYVASLYAQWEAAIPDNGNGYTDGSMHRLLSDLEPLLVYRDRPVIIAGDFNLMLDNIKKWPGADWVALQDSVFSRLSALGLQLAGPQYPNGVLAEEPEPHRPDNKNVPTFRSSAGNICNQLDYVYATPDIVDSLKVRALNRYPDEWGSSDHCRIEIDIRLDSAGTNDSGTP